MKKEFERLRGFADKMLSMSVEERRDWESKLYTEGWGYYKTIVKMPQDSFNALSTDEKFDVNLLVNIADDDIKDGREFNPEAFIEAANFIYKGCDKSEGVKKALLDAFDYFATYDLLNDHVRGLEMSMSLFFVGECSFHVKEKICDTDHSLVITRERLNDFVPVWTELRLTAE